MSTVSVVIDPSSSVRPVIVASLVALSSGAILLWVLVERW
jgi:hypothetical protein